MYFSFFIIINNPLKIVIQLKFNIKNLGLYFILTIFKPVMYVDVVVPLALPKILTYHCDDHESIQTGLRYRTGC